MTDEAETPSVGFDRALGLIGSGASVRAATTLATSGASFITTVLLVRLLGASLYGALALGLSIVGLATAVNRNGFGVAATRTIAAHLAVGNRQGARDTTRGLSTIVVGGGLIGLVLIVSIVEVTQVQLSVAQRLVVGLGLGLLLMGSDAATASGAVARGFGRVLLMEIPALVGIFSKLVIVTALFALGISNIGVAATALGASGLAATVVAARITWHAVSAGDARVLRPSLSSAHRLLRVVVPYVMAGVAAKLIASFDVLVLGATHPGRGVGSYAPVLTLLEAVVMLVPFLLSTLFVTAATGLMTTGDISGFTKLYLTVSKFSILIAMPAFCLLATAPVGTFQAVYGTRFPVDPSVVWILLVGYFVNVSFGVNTQALISSGERRLARAFMLPAIAMVLSSLFLIPPFGALGAAAATSVSYLVLNLSISWTLYRATGVHPLHRGLVSVVATAPLAIVGTVQLYKVIGGGFWVASFLSLISWCVWILLARLLGAFRFGDLRGFIPDRRDFTPTWNENSSEFDE